MQKLHEQYHWIEVIVRYAKSVMVELNAQLKKCPDKYANKQHHNQTIDLLRVEQNTQTKSLNVFTRVLMIIRRSIMG
jgi:hypothetical protein